MGQGKCSPHAIAHCLAAATGSSSATIHLSPCAGCRLVLRTKCRVHRTAQTTRLVQQRVEARHTPQLRLLLQDLASHGRHHTGTAVS